MRHAFLAAVCVVGTLNCVAAEEEGSCDLSLERTKKIVFAKVDRYTDGAETIEFWEACNGERRAVRRCAVVRAEKHELQKACFPTDGSPQYFEPAYRIEFYEQDRK